MDAATLAQARVIGDRRYFPRGHTIVLLGNSRIERETTTSYPGRSSDLGMFGIANAKMGGRLQQLEQAASEFSRRVA